MTRTTSVVPAIRSRLSWAGLLAMLASTLLVAVACPGSTDVTKITGTYDVTSFDCNGLPDGVPAGLAARIASERTYSFAFSDDGDELKIEMIDPSCTWGGQYNLGYFGLKTGGFDSRVVLTGIGSYTCAPSAAACAPLLAVENPSRPAICGTANSETARLGYGAVPQNSGETLTLSSVDSTACKDNGGTDPLRLVLTRQPVPSARP